MMVLTLDYAVCDICGRRFYGTADHIEICGNCGNERYFTFIWVDSEQGDDYGQA